MAETHAAIAALTCTYCDFYLVNEVHVTSQYTEGRGCGLASYVI
jgi:hypothetical protein